MKLRGLVLIGVLALLVAAPAGGHALEVITIPDGTGDGDPDITSVTAGSNAAGGVTFVVALGNRTQLAENEFVFVFIDSDLNAATGAAPNGVDYALQLDRGDVGLFRWNGSDFVDTESQTVYGYTYKGFRIALNKSDLAMTSTTLRFWVESASGDKSDDAPNGEMVSYDLSQAPLKLTVRGFSATAKTVKAGKRFAVGLQAHRDDLNEITSAGLVRCAAKYGKKSVKVTAGFPDDIAVCAGTAPKAAKGKTLKVTLTLELDGSKVSRTASIKVR